ncbi:MAG: hypothetical protein GY833_22670 [Aestuariibacter sp.]|nr:hypothetical protein [Aestuariibacter sp.]|tara:strand:- start:231804 stop:232433 length:630 start_codon:yes stop_codon:yes gene_type:complete
MGLFNKKRHIVYEQLLVLPAHAQCPKAFKFDIDVDVTSHSKDKLGRQFSPFLLGDVYVESGLWAHCVENAWQFSKVYSEHTDLNGDPTPAWYSWREAGLERDHPVHAPMGRGAKHLYWYHKGKKLNAREAREQLFKPWYMELAMNTDAWDWLTSEYLQGKRILMRDFKAIDHVAEQRTFTECLAEPTIPLCHGYLLGEALESLNEKARN